MPLSRLQAAIERFAGWLPPTLTRISLGLLFVETGWAKVHNFLKVIEYFTSLGIPFPTLNAHIVGYTELICGGLLLLGLFSRLATIPLMISMTVAVLTAKWPDVQDFTDLFGFAEYLYIILLFWLLVRGPGFLSLDHLIFRKSKFSQVV